MNKPNAVYRLTLRGTENTPTSAHVCHGQEGRSCDYQLSEWAINRDETNMTEQTDDGDQSVKLTGSSVDQSPITASSVPLIRVAHCRH